MPLINCPECNREISDKVKACPHCGYPFEVTFGTDQAAQKVEITSVNIKPRDPQKTKKVIRILVGIMLVLALVITASLLITENDKKVAAEATKMAAETTRIAEETAYNDYIDNTRLLLTLMLDGGSDAETLCNLTARVWYNTIYEKSDPTTDKYTKKISGSYFFFYDDFNDALDNLYTDSSTKSTVSSIKASQVLVQELMKKLQNPPKGLETSYGTINDLYSAYQGLTDLAISPKGNLNSYTQNKSNRIDEFMKFYEKLKTQIPEKK